MNRRNFIYIYKSYLQVNDLTEKTINLLNKKMKKKINLFFNLNCLTNQWLPSIVIIKLLEIPNM